MNIELGATFEGVRSKIFCAKCDGRGYERHHVTYMPEDIALLCGPCHREITTLNRMASRRVPRGCSYRPLSNKMRRSIYTRWLNG